MVISEGEYAKMIIVGIDVGGTNTDAALISGGKIKATAKVPTNYNQLLESTVSAFEVLLNSYGSRLPEDGIELHLSTTLSTNAIIQEQGDPTAVLAVPGPGMNIKQVGLRFPIYILSGSIDHRGREVAPLDPKEVRAAVTEAKNEGALALAVVGKFSHRNPSHELTIEGLIRGDTLFKAGYITLGHRLSGRPNFPRRMATSYLNASIARRQASFCSTIREFMVRGKNVRNVFLLKADGGTMRLEDSLIRPIETILSGPAASIMGAESLSAYPYLNTVIIDIGGTTTDISCQIKGDTVFQRQGAEISGYKTLVPALFSRSIGLGGDSEINITNTPGDSGFSLRIGPKRAGTPAAFGGNYVTPTDAAVVLGLAKIGSLVSAENALSDFSKPYGIEPKELAQMIIDTFTQQLTLAIKEIYEDLQSQPVYTVSEILAPPDIQPQAVIGLGAPAKVFIPPVAKHLGLKYQILPYSESANAIGAAASCQTAGITLHADTALGVMTVPEAGYTGRIERPILFDIRRARKEATERATEFARNLGLDEPENIKIVEEESFNMVRGFHTIGRTFMVRAQVRPKVTRLSVPFSQC
ncbi:MAG: hydantoinase/oxoprolinase family protein [Firmicutes bacterium]|nr:hydantoinase/oxoprolinase family protein [Bacillota bacterium]